MKTTQMEELLGDEYHALNDHVCRTFPKTSLHLPGGDWVDRIFSTSERNINVLRNLQQLLGHGNLKDTGYVSILPVDQGIEHSAGASFAPNPIYFDPENIIKLAIEGGTNGVATTLGTLGLIARKYAHKIPLILKINHNQLLSHPNQFDQTLFAQIEQAHELGCVAVGATIYFGSQESNGQIKEIAKAFHRAHELGLATILWCYLRNPAFKSQDKDFHLSADLSGQANHLGATIGADIVKQKLPENNGGYEHLNQSGRSFGKFHKKMYSELSTDHPIDLCRYQVINCYAGRVGLINSGGASSGQNDLKDALRTAIINKRAGGMGLISGRKAFQRPMKEGVQLLEAIQAVYLNKDITVA